MLLLFSFVTVAVDDFNNHIIADVHDDHNTATAISIAIAIAIGIAFGQQQQQQ